MKENCFWLKIEISCLDCAVNCCLWWRTNESRIRIRKMTVQFLKERWQLVWNCKLHATIIISVARWVNTRMELNSKEAWASQRNCEKLCRLVSVYLSVNLFVSWHARTREPLKRFPRKIIFGRFIEICLITPNVVKTKNQHKAVRKQKNLLYFRKAELYTEKRRKRLIIRRTHNIYFP